MLESLSKSNKTTDEIAVDIGESILNVRPRVSELKKMGKVIATGDRRKNMTIQNRSNKSANVWTLRKGAAKQVQSTMFETQKDASSL